MLKKASLGTVITLLLLGTLYNFVPDPKDTHFCEDLMDAKHCDHISSTGKTCYANNYSRIGSKLCRGGWVEINKLKTYYGYKFLCVPGTCEEVIE